MSDDAAVLTEQRGRVRLITLNRPERLNAWNDAINRGYFDALDDAAADPDVYAIVVTGAGRGFCAGADMDNLQGLSDGDGGRERPAEPDLRKHTHALGIPKPVIAAVNGACAGLGFVHACAADIRFAAKGAKFTTAFARRGLVAEHGVSWTLPRLVGPGRAADLLMSGRVFLAEEAHDMGLVEFLSEADEVVDDALRYADDLARHSAPSSMQTMKRQVWGHLDVGIEEALAESNRLMAESLRRPDFKEGVASFVEKRDPDFSPVGD